MSLIHSVAVEPNIGKYIASSAIASHGKTVDEKAKNWRQNGKYCISLVMEQRDPWRQFEDLVGRIFSFHNFRVDREVIVPVEGRSSRRVADIVLSYGGVRTVVEIKAYRSRTPGLADIGRAALQAADVARLIDAEHAALVISLRRDQLPELSMVSHGITVVGMDDLIAISGENSGLLAELANVARELNSGLGDFERPTDMSPARDPVTVAQFMHTHSGPAPTTPPPPDKGARLAAELAEIKPGKTKTQSLSSGRTGVSWRLFENVGFESFQYVFEDELGGWSTQKAVGGDANRFDAMAKVKGDDVFCRTLIEDFRTRHLLIEFKNYSDQIGANSVHITEKYLFPTALRSTAIILSHKGLSRPAQGAARGALRDAGKLFLDVTVEMLCEMLQAKDRGVSASQAMEIHLDQLLQSLGR